MRPFLPALVVLVLLTSCSTTDPVITANPDRANSTSGTAASSPATNGPVPKSTDTLSVPPDSTVQK